MDDCLSLFRSVLLLRLSVRWANFLSLGLGVATRQMERFYPS